MKCWSKCIHFIQETAFENIVCEMVAILPRPQCVKRQLWPSIKTGGIVTPHDAMVAIGCSNGSGLSPIRRQSITWTHGGILSIGPLRTNSLQWNFNQYIPNFIQANAFENVCQMSAILFRPQRVTFITMTPYEHHHRQLDCWVSLFNLISRKTSKFYIAGPWTHRWPVVPLTKGQLCGKRFHVMTSSYQVFLPRRYLVTVSIYRCRLTNIGLPL